jgi:hypothetical protein
MNTLPLRQRPPIAAIELYGQTTAEVVHTKPPGGPFWQLVELFLTFPRRLAARWVSLTAALVVAVAGSGPRPFTLTATQVPRQHRLRNDGKRGDGAQ